MNSTATLILTTLLAVSRVSASSIYLSNEVSNRGVSYYDLVTGAYQGSVPGTYITPTDLAFDSSGNLFFSDANVSSHVTFKFDPSTNTVTPFVTLPNGAYGIAFDPAGNLYITTPSSGMVYKYSSSGVLLGSVSVPGARGLSYNPVDGNFYVATTPTSSASSNQIVRLTTSLIATTFATTHLNQARTTAIDAAGNIVVTNGVQNGAVEAFALSGAYLGSIAANVMSANQPAFTSGGLYPFYVTEFGSNDVLKCTAANTCSVFLSQGPGTGTGGLAIGPTAIPEPASGVSLSLALAGLAATAASRRRNP